MLVARALLALVALSSAPILASASQAARHAHRAVAHRRRDDPSSTGRCIPRTSSALSTTASPPPTSVPTSTAPSTASSAPSPTTSPGGGKGCFAWGADPSYLANFQFPQVQYFYDWRPDIPSQVAETGLKAMPMLWGANQQAAFAETVVAGYATIALGPNEPNESSQSYLSPQDAFNMWMTYINPLKQKGYQLVSAACTNDDAGLEWYREFFEYCTAAAGCHVDIIAFHGYTTEAQAIIDYATQLHETYSVSIAITEFADQNFSGTGGQATMDEIWDFAGKMVEFVSQTDWIVMACPFGLLTDVASTGVNSLNALMTADGYPTALANYYFKNL